jgi:hypothetical protein
MYEERIEAFREHVGELRGVSEESIAAVNGALDAIAQFDTTFQAFKNPALQDGTTIQSTIESTLDALRDAVSAGSSASLLSWVTSATERLYNYVIQLINEHNYSENVISTLRHVIAVSVEAGQRAYVLLDREALRSAVEQANSLVEEIKEQAGIAGETANLTFYRDFAATELKAAHGFRVASIVLISVTVAVAAIYAIVEAIPSDPAEPDWTAVVYRTAILVGIGALSAYLARQAGQHRRLYNWANALEVQLQSFQNFIAPMTDEERHEVRLHFARRVLGSPPDPKTGESSDDTVPTAQLLDIASAAIRRGTTA